MGVDVASGGVETHFEVGQPSNEKAALGRPFNADRNVGFALGYAERVGQRDQFDLQARMKALQFADMLRQEQVAEIIGRSYAHHAFDLLRLSGKIALDFPNGTLQRLDILVQSLTRLSETITFG